MRRSGAGGTARWCYNDARALSEWYRIASDIGPRAKRRTVGKKGDAETRRRGWDQLVAFIWVQMEFFLNGRFESLPLSGIVWSAAEGREERGDAGASAMRNQSAKALISWRHEVKGFPDCSSRIYSWFVRFPRGNCRSAVRCLSSHFSYLHLLFPSLPFSSFPFRIEIAFRREI